MPLFSPVGESRVRDTDFQLNTAEVDIYGSKVFAV
tara:strand:+ start:703 stop:807 length:105 start_codon:yes stop_codon:yes gene_type:complete